MLRGLKTRPNKKLAILGGSLLFIVPFLTLVSYDLPNKHMDFYYFYYSFQVVWQRLPADLMYNLPAQHNWFRQHDFHIYQFDQYVYPPQFAVLFAWLANFKLPLAGQLWSWFDIVTYLLGIRMIDAFAHPTKKLFPRVVFYITTLLNFPFWFDLSVGNANWLIFFLVSAGIYFRYVRQWPWLAGVPLGLAVVFKVTPIVFLVYLLLRREWKVFVSGTLTILISTAMTALTVGFAPLQYYVLHLTSFTTTSMRNGFAPFNSSLLGVLGLWQQHKSIDWSAGVIHSVFLLYLALLAMVIGLAFFVTYKRPQHDSRTTVALGVLTTLVFSPLIEATHLLIAWIAVWLLFGYWWETHAQQKNTTRKRWKSVGVVLIFAWLWTALSPIGWILLPSIPTEYFYSLLALTALSLVMIVAKTGPTTASQETTFINE